MNKIDKVDAKFKLEQKCLTGPQMDPLLVARCLKFAIDSDFFYKEGG